MNLFEEEIDSVHIIESLRENDQETGTLLYDHIKDRIVTKLHVVENTDDLFEKLDNVLESISADKCFVLNIESHGNKAGIQIGNGDYVSWREVLPYLKKLNKKTNTRMIVLNSSCFGGYFCFQSTITEYAPAFASIGSDRKINSDRLLKANKKIFDLAFAGKNMEEIKQSVNDYLEVQDDNYSFVSVYDVFVQSWTKYVKESCSPMGVVHRILFNNDVFEQYANETGKPKKWFQEKYVQGILEKNKIEEKYNELRDVFLGCGTNPESYERFYLDFDEIYEEANLNDLYKQFISEISRENSL